MTVVHSGGAAKTVVIVAWAMTVSVVARALDLVVHGGVPRIRDYAFLPPDIWGSAFAVAAVLLIVGLVCSRWQVVALGAFAAGIAYLAAAVVQGVDLVKVAEYDEFRWFVESLARGAAWWVISLYALQRAAILELRGRV